MMEHPRPDIMRAALYAPAQIDVVSVMPAAPVALLRGRVVPAGRPDGPDGDSAGSETGMLVVLVGIDGAGKSTAARLLKDRILLSGGRALLLQNSSGRSVISIWCARHHVRLHPGLADMVETAIRVGHVLVAHLRARRFDGLVLMDRHLYCQLALRAVRGLPPGRLLPWLLRHLPQPDLVVFFNTPPRVAHARIKRRGTDRESLQFLQALSAAYGALPEYPTFVAIAVSGTPTETTNQLVELLAENHSIVDRVSTAGTLPKPLQS